MPSILHRASSTSLDQAISGKPCCLGLSEYALGKLQMRHVDTRELDQYTVAGSLDDAAPLSAKCQTWI